MSEFWKQVTDNIDERFTDEAAEYFAKHSGTESADGSAGSCDAKAISLNVEKCDKKQGKGRIIAVICAAAAAVVICVLGGMYLLKSENPLLPAETSSTEASDSQETQDTSEITEDVVQHEIYVAEAELVMSDTISEQDIIRQAGYDIPLFDDYSEEAHRQAQEYVNNLPDGDEKQQLTAQNYWITGLVVSYVGSDTADWICALNYYTCYYQKGKAPAIYSRVFYVKDGLITENIFEADRESIVTRDCGYVYISIGNGGFYVLDTDTMEIKEITSESGYFVSGNGDYVLFRNATKSSLQVYVMESGEIIPTDIYKGEYDAGTTEVMLLADRIRCYELSDKTLYDIMLPSGGIQQVSMSYDEAFRYGSGYTVQTDTVSYSYPEHRITINDLSTGLSETLYLDDFSDTLYNTQRCNVGMPKIFDSVLYIPVSNGDGEDRIYITYDIKTGSAMYFVPDGITDFIYDSDNLIGLSYEPDDIYVEYSKLTLIPVSSEADRIDICCDVLRADGNKVIGVSAEDFNFDGVAELFILTEKNGSKALRIYEKQRSGWENVSVCSDKDYVELPNTSQFIRYDDGYERYCYTMSENGLLVQLSFVADDESADGGTWNISSYHYRDYKTPIEYPEVLYSLCERFPDVDPDPQIFAESLTTKLMYALADGNEDYERTFNIISWDIGKVEVIPISEAPDCYNITEEERALTNAWIVEPEVRFTYDGKVSGKRGNTDEWYDGLGAENIGFLMWLEGDTFFLRSRWLNCGTKQLMTDDELDKFLEDNLKPALDMTNLIYFSGDAARTAGMPMIEDGLYEVMPDFPYSSVEDIKAAAAEYYSEDAVAQLNIDSRFTVADGKLCALTFNKGVGCSGYTAENAEILSQYSFAPYSKVVIKLMMTDALIMNKYSTECYGTVTLVYDELSGKWLFSHKII